MTGKIKILFLLSILALKGLGQGTPFSNINTSDGLSDNFIRAIEVDKKGVLWIGTNEGLNSYDGYSITNYPLTNYPAIPDKTVYHLYCDSNNILWIGGPKGGAWADERRNFHPILLDDSISEYNCWIILGTKKYGPLIITDKGEYYGGSANGHWKKINWLPPVMDFSKTFEMINFDDDKLLVSMVDRILLVDYNTEKILYQYPVPDILSICRVRGNEVALADSKGTMRIIDITNGKVLKNFDFTIYNSPKVIATSWVEIRMAADGNILYASQSHGFSIIDSTGRVSHFSHDPVNPYSIASDRVVRLLGKPNGDVVIGTERSGLSIMNLKRKLAGYQKVFSNGKGDLFDSWLTQIVKDKDGTFWMGSTDRLIHWNKKTNISTFYYYTGKTDGTVTGKPEVHRLHMDQSGQIWAAVLGAGTTLFNKSTGSFTTLPRDEKDSSQQSSWVYDFLETKDGKMWIASQSGLYYIDIKTRKTHSLQNDSLLKPFNTIWVESLAEDSLHRIWISTRGKGLICYDPVRRTVKQYTTKDGLLDDVSLELFCSSTNDLYVCMFKGFNIVHPDGTISTYTKANGLMYDKTDAFLEDDNGNIWIANAKCLARFDPATKSIRIFDEHANLNNGGFKPNSAIKTDEGELLWSTQSGINYFFPDRLTNTEAPIQLSLYTVIAGDSSYAISDKITRLPYRRNSLEFNFGAVNLGGSHGIHYQYKLEGYDKDWIEGIDIRQVRYPYLQPGHYTFLVRASTGRTNWTASSNRFSFDIIAPLRMRWWFKLSVALLVAGLLLYLFGRRNRQLRQKREELETEQAINYFASSIYEQQTEEDILWDVARNCIGRLQFEDCVIYLLDEKRNVLVQKAAHGPKSPRTFEINQPLEIPAGKGIVGYVAEHKKAEIVADTSKDSRYIADDQVRSSEITVPIVSDGKVIGVIDCEHSKKGFFTQKHLSILTTIASLCAGKIVKARAEVQKKEAETMLAETKQKMAEAEMQALRAQMNPHFIFNCLNSINRYIVKSDQATASLYLTRFAKLIRLILDNSHSKNVILANEIEALKLYIDMESLRFENKFSYEITVDKNVPVESIEVPPLIIQPYIENAIWHGLLHKPEAGRLNIHISLAAPDMLQCVIEDNGVGREKASELKSKTATKKKSLGMELTENRLLLLNQYASVHSSITIEDLKDDNGEATGTRVTLKIPIGEI